MTRLIAFAVLAFLPQVLGCRASDYIFSALSDHYSEGGTTLQEKQYHYHQQVEAAEQAQAQ